MDGSQGTMVEVLLVEDDEGDANLVLYTLQSIPGCRAAREVRLSGALAALRREAFDVVLLDLGLPDEVGLPVLRRVLDTAADVAVIVLTGLDDEQVAIASLREGAEDYLVKGKTSGELLNQAIRYAIERKRQARERSALERRLAHTQRLESLGRFAGGIAHEINNRLMPIVSGADFLLGTFPDDDRRRQMLELILQAANSAGDLVKSLLMFARHQPVEDKQRLDLAGLIEETLLLVRPAMPNRVTIATELAEDLPPMSGSPTQMQSLVMNLVSNAVDAMADGRQGRVRLVLDGVAEANATLLRFKVIDDGIGMDEATQARVFEPFFTTKPVNRGTGLGLSVVHGIVSDHGGRITVASRPGGGTVVEVLLPALPSTKDAPWQAS
ncbi:MAG: sensor histidine kinase [Actinomycetota bacterium]